MTGKRLKTKQATTTKRVVWFCLFNGVAWVWCSYLLAYLDRAEIAESLSKVAITEIIGVVLVYAMKSLLEKRQGFGSVGIDSKKSESADTIPANTDRDF